MCIRDRPEPVVLTKSEVKRLFEECGVEDEKLQSFDEQYEIIAGDWSSDVCSSDLKSANNPLAAVLGAVNTAKQIPPTPVSYTHLNARSASLRVSNDLYLAASYPLI